MKIDADDRQRIGDAVIAAEAITDGEVMVIAAVQSDAYHDVALQWAVVGMFLVLAVQAAVPGHFVPVLDWALRGGWADVWPLWFLLTAQLVLLAVVFLLPHVRLQAASHAHDADTRLDQGAPRPATGGAAVSGQHRIAHCHPYRRAALRLGSRTSG